VTLSYWYYSNNKNTHLHDRETILGLNKADYGIYGVASFIAIDEQL